MTARKTDLTKERDEKIREILLEIEKSGDDYAKKKATLMSLTIAF